MSKIFVIAGTVNEAEQWIKEDLRKRHSSGVTTLSWSDYVIVRDPTKLKGYSQPHGVFIGTWRMRKDMEEIFQTLLINHDITQNTHRVINQLWGEWKEANPRPIPKKTASPYDSAAGLLAKEIDAEVLRSLTQQAVNGGQLTQRQEEYKNAWHSLFKEKNQ